MNNSNFIRKLFLSVIFCLSFFFSFAGSPVIRALVVTGGHGYNRETFNAMLESLGEKYSFKIVEFPEAFDMFSPERRNDYDVLLFYHMWQNINTEQEKMFADCIRSGKPLVALHHSICAFDNWEEYWRIIGGKYFHKPTVLDGKEYPACSYIHDIKFTVKVAARHPVTKGVRDFEIFDETYKGYWVDPEVKVLLTTDEQSSNPVIGWTKTYGKSRIVTLQSGHDTPTFENPNFRRLLKQAIEWVVK